MIDIACRRHGFDRLEVRRRDLVPPKAMPYRATSAEPAHIPGGAPAVVTSG